jgi:hypothetical protein
MKTFVTFFHLQHSIAALASTFFPGGGSSRVWPLTFCIRISLFLVWMTQDTSVFTWVQRFTVHFLGGGFLEGAHLSAFQPFFILRMKRILILLEPLFMKHRPHISKVMCHVPPATPQPNPFARKRAKNAPNPGSLLFCFL